MSIGSILVGIAVLAVVVAYLARPFRPADSASIDRTIETWVRQVQDEELDPSERAQEEHAGDGMAPAGAEPAARSVNYCSQCGQRVASDDRFCSSCGARLRRSTR